ncbi:conserved hypothetical protein [Pyrobaculum neutrophilum V24Sta]|uniref:ASCH domain-containing protein n=2 Tax=Pyrobaculum neutrophilum TaxID=70771 RepID=B1YDM8_PYRNV|nr:conserved hypothetical protein [Pyrobaculum neutrophilum V24Sta]
MSIKPQLGRQILAGQRRCELRRLAGPLVQPGDAVYLYFTKPAAAVAGRFTAGLVFIAPPRSLPRLLQQLGDCGVGEEDTRRVQGARYAVLIEARSPAPCAAPVPPAAAGLRPPPSYRRLDPRSAARLEALCRGEKI